jgi:hypothetical protein
VKPGPVHLNAQQLEAAWAANAKEA